MPVIGCWEEKIVLGHERDNLLDHVSGILEIVKM